MAETAQEQQQLRELLQAALDPSKAKAATEQLRQLLQQQQQPAVYLLLAEEVLRGEKEETRQLAAVLLRRKAAKFFSSLQPNQQSEFTESLVGRLGCEPSKPVRHSLGHLLAALLRLPQFDEAKTKHVLQLLAAPILEQQQPQLQVAAVEVFAAYVESGDGTETFFDELLHIFQQALTISNNNPALAGPALEGLRGLAEDAVEPSQQKKLFALLPGVTAVIEKAFQPEGDESVAMGALELIDDLLCNDLVLSESELLSVLHFLLGIAARPALDVGVRQQALAPIHWAAKQKPRVLCKGGFVPKLLDVLVEMAAQPDEPGCAVLEDEDDEDEELNPHRLACQTVDAIAVALPNKHICKPLLQRLEAYIHPTAPRTPEQEVLQQRAALTCIGIMSEGCEAALRGKLKAFMPFLIPLLQHSHPAVAAAAALCFGQFAEYLQPEIMQYQSQVLPLLLQQLDNPNRLVQHKACYAPSDSVREVCLSAIRSAAVASVAEEDDGEARPQGTPRPFDPYAADLFRLLEDIIRSPTVPRGNSGGAGTAAAGCSPATKARAIGVIGGLVKGLSPQCYQQQLRQLLQLVVQQVDGGEGQGEAAQESAHEIRDEAFACFRDVSSALKEEFVPFLEDVMVRVLASLFSSEGFTSPEEPGDFDLGDSGDESTGAGRELQIRDGYLDELDSAAFCLRSLWENCGGHCMKYLQKTCEAIEVLKTHFHDAARQQASFLIAAVLLAAHKTLANPQEQHSQQQAQGTVQCMQPHVLQLWKTQLYPLLFAIISEDVDKETVGDAFSALGTVLEGVGPAAIYSAEQRESLLLQCSNLLRGKHICQLNQDVDEDDDSRQEEEYLFEGLVAFLAALAAAASQATAAVAATVADPAAASVAQAAAANCNIDTFCSAYTQLHPHILALAAHKHSKTYAAIGLGCFAEVFREMQGSAVQYAESPAVLKAVGSGISQEEDEDCRRNACFCLSVIYEVAGSSPAVNSKSMELLQLMHPIFRPRDDLNKSEQSTVDNACSAVASMLLHAPPSGLPMGDVVRVFLSSLPLQADREESKTVLQALLHLAATQSDIVLQNSEQFMFACACEASFPGAARRIGSELTASAQQLLQEMCKNPQLPSGTLDALATRLQSKPYALAFLRQ
ncbi:importin-4 [Cyclospora cayetanensis]|uniref:Importin-4 n=1 Tax=Cyclospora cayetanensis TaxID=88456 RepID=A0A6P6RTE3_9EIME|nr:importin-4 [Cyclospora cayetanensis]